MVNNSKSLAGKVWEFIISLGGILGILILLGARIEQGVVYSIFGGGVIIVTLDHIVSVSFFQNIDKNIKYIKDLLENERGGKNDK